MSTIRQAQKLFSAAPAQALTDAAALILMVVLVGAGFALPAFL